MGIRAIKPTTPANRFATRSDFSEITKSYPEKSLTKSLRKTGGRNNNGRITVRHRGGGHRRRYRIIDFKRDKFDIPAKVASIEYDPNRSANIALLHYSDGEKRYILSPFGVKVNDEVVSGQNAPLKIGNALPISKVATGMFVHNIELEPGRGGQMVRSAGAARPQHGAACTPRHRGVRQRRRWRCSLRRVRGHGVAQGQPFRCPLRYYPRSCRRLPTRVQALHPVR